MGTRCLTFVYEEDDIKPFVCLYRQHDGYKAGHGKDLAKFLAPMGVVNGFGNGEVAGTAANGMGCLAAQLVAHFKGPHGIGGFYLQAPDLGQDSGQEFEYHIFPDSKIKVIENGDPDTVIFNGSWVDFVRWTNDEAYRKYPTLREAFRQGETVVVTFTNAAGNTRVMKCTQNGTHIPTEKQTTTAARTVYRDPKVYKVFDLEKNDWRSFRDERIIDWHTI